MEQSENYQRTHTQSQNYGSYDFVSDSRVIDLGTGKTALGAPASGSDFCGHFDAGCSLVDWGWNFGIVWVFSDNFPTAPSAQPFEEDLELVRWSAAGW